MALQRLLTYYRRPDLAGVSLDRVRLQQATIRGNLRRSDPDNNFAAPHFKNVPNGGTFIVGWASDGFSFVNNTLTIASNGDSIADFATVISSFNTQLQAAGAAMQAFDAGGCLGLRSTVTGGLGVIFIGDINTGDPGTAAAALGYAAPSTLPAFASAGGDLMSAPEGRGAGQPFEASLPVVGEGLSSDVITRTLGRMMANSDILYSELAKYEVVMALGPEVTIGATASEYLSLGALVPVFTNIPGGVNYPDWLTTLFQVTDKSTRQPVLSKVVDIVDTNNVSVVGTEQVVTGPVAISEVKSGLVVECSGANFTTAGVLEGDLVEISGAANNAPWTNNGFRWIVEAVIDATHLSLRSMSATEIAWHAGNLASFQRQPVVELNASRQGNESWGNITVRRGVFRTGVKLKVSPALPPGMVVEIWMPQRQSGLAKSTTNVVGQRIGMGTERTHDYDPSQNCILSRPTVTFGATTVIVGPFMARWHGRVVRHPTITLTPGANGGGATTTYIYWDETDGLVKKSWFTSDLLIQDKRDGTTTREQNGYTPNSAHKGHLIAVVRTDGAGNVQAGTSKQVTRTNPDFSLSLTCGINGQFPTLQEALNFVTEWGASVQYGMSEIVVLSDQTAPNGGFVVGAVTAPNVGVSVRGATPQVLLTHGASGPLFAINPNAGAVLLANFRADLTPPKVLSTGGTNVFYQGIFNTGGSSQYHRSLDTPGTLNVGRYASAVNIGDEAAGISIGGSSANISIGQEAGTIYFGYEASAIVFGAPATRARFRGSVDFDAGLDVTVKADGANGGAKLAGTTGEGVLTLTDPNDANPATLTRDALAAIAGGATSIADAYHNHSTDQMQAIARAAANAAIAATQVDDGTTDIGEPDARSLAAFGYNNVDYRYLIYGIASFKLYRSADGTNWVEEAIAGGTMPGDMRGVYHFGNYKIVIGDDRIAYCHKNSTNGWAAFATAGYKWYAAGDNGSRIIVTGKKVATSKCAIAWSSDGLNWNIVDTTIDGSFGPITYGALVGVNRWVVLGTGNSILTTLMATSSDGVTWTPVSLSSPPWSWGDIVWSPTHRRFFASGSTLGGMSFWSSNGLDWSSMSATGMARLLVAEGVLIGISSGIFATSLDGTTWYGHAEWKGGDDYSPHTICYSSYTRKVTLAARNSNPHNLKTFISTALNYIGTRLS